MVLSKQANFIKWLRDYGYSSKEIANKLECTPENIRNILNNHGWKYRPRCKGFDNYHYRQKGGLSYNIPKNGQDKFIKWLYDYGYSLRKIAPHFNYSYENIRLIFKANNWKRRTKKEASKIYHDRPDLHNQDSVINPA